MGSVGNTSPWAPYNTYKDCSQEICSIYCPQYCYLIFPPPPSDNGNHAPFSPLIIAIISVLASALLLVIYYTFVTRFCRRRDRSTTMVVEEDHEELVPDPCQVGTTGLDEAVIKMIMVKKYKKGEMKVEGSECVVCLSEFQENEALRVLPKCDHMFHLPCIDTWLASNSVCPLCRASVVALAPHPLTHRSPLQENSHDNGDHMILVLDNQERRQADGNGLGRDHDHIPCESPSPETRNEVSASDQNQTVTWFRRSKSLGTFSYMQKVSGSHVKLEDNFTGNNRSPRGTGSSKELGVKRSFSTGRLMFTYSNKEL